MVNVYGAHDQADKTQLWIELHQQKVSRQGIWVFLGDFNEVRNDAERFIS